MSSKADQIIAHVDQYMSAEDVGKVVGNGWPVPFVPVPFVPSTGKRGVDIGPLPSWQGIMAVKAVNYAQLVMEGHDESLTDIFKDAMAKVTGLIGARLLESFLGKVPEPVPMQIGLTQGMLDKMIQQHPVQSGDTVTLSVGPLSIS